MRGKMRGKNKKLQGDTELSFCYLTRAGISLLGFRHTPCAYYFTLIHAEKFPQSYIYIIDNCFCVSFVILRTRPPDINSYSPISM